MRILRLDFGPDIGSADLHPFVSVVHGLDEARSSRLISAIRSLVTGSGLGLAGLVEHNGHLVDVTGENLADIGPFTTEDVVMATSRFTGGAANLPQMVAELDQLAAAAQIDSVWVEEVRADLVPTAAARVQRLRDQLDGVHVQPIDLELQARRARMREAIAAVDGTNPVITESPDGIAELIAEWQELQRAEARSRGHLDTIAARVQQAEAALADAKRFLADAEADAKPVLLSPEDEDRLDQLCHPKVERRFRPRERSAETEAEIATLLAKVNQTSYSGYAMYRLMPTASEEKLAVVGAAEDQVDAAQAEVDQARHAMTYDQTAVQLAEVADGIKARAREFFGPMLPADLGRALQEHVVESPNPVWFDRVRELYDALVENDVEVPDDLEPEKLTIWADGWLMEQERLDLEANRVDPGMIQAELDAAEKALDRHARAMARIDRLEAKAAESRQRVSELRRRIARIEAGDASSIESVFEGVSELAERVRDNAGVSIPIVIKGNFGDLDDADVTALLDRIEPLAQSVQIVVMTDRNAAATWARTVGVRRALCAGTVA
ncbi:MAG: hypothetical protein R2733_20980 [Acidimicrobiales bacterium]